MVRKIVAVEIGSPPGPASCLELPARTHEPQFEPMSWADPEYRLKRFEECGRYTLYYGGILPASLPSEDSRVLQFILRYLAGGDGPLFRWLRDEKAVVYDISWRYDRHLEGVRWEMRFPMASEEEALAVRQELPERIRAALADASMLRTEVGLHRDAAETYWYQTLGDILADATFDLALYGEIVSEAAALAAIGRCADPDYVAEAWARAASVEKVGWFCAAPLEQTD